MSKKDARIFLLVLVGAVVATLLLGSLVRAGETWAVPVTIAIAVVVSFTGLRRYRKLKQAESKQARSKQTKGGRNG